MPEHLLSKNEEILLHRAVNEACPYHNPQKAPKYGGAICIHLALGKLIGAAIVSGRFMPTVLPEDKEVSQVVDP